MLKKITFLIAVLFFAVQGIAQPMIAFIEEPSNQVLAPDLKSDVLETYVPSKELTFNLRNYFDYYNIILGKKIEKECSIYWSIFIKAVLEDYLYRKDYSVNERFE